MWVLYSANTNALQVKLMFVLNSGWRDSPGSTILLTILSVYHILTLDKAFDWILNFSSEVEMIWKAKWNLVKVLYLITRYLPLAIIPLDLFCELDVSPLY